MIPTTIHPDQAMDVWRRVKERAGGDLSPQLDVLLVDGSRHIVVVGDRDDVVHAVDAITKRADLPVQSVAFLADAYGYVIEAKGVPQSPLRYTPSEMFRRGDPNASEMLVVTVIGPDEAVVCREMPYKMTPQGPSFGEVRTPGPGEVTGAVVDVLREAMRRFR